MKKIVLTSIALVIMSICYLLLFNTKEVKAENCCAKCTGSSSCRACKNCKYCAHCNSGGSCGVCSSPSPASIAPKKTKTSTSTVKSHSVNTQYLVSANTLNVRSTPSINSSILFTLKLNQKVTILKIIDKDWVKISYNNKEGYVYKQYLSE